MKILIKVHAKNEKEAKKKASISLKQYFPNDKFIFAEKENTEEYNYHDSFIYPAGYFSMIAMINSFTYLLSFDDENERELFEPYYTTLPKLNEFFNDNSPLNLYFFIANTEISLLTPAESKKFIKKLKRKVSKMNRHKKIKYYLLRPINKWLNR